MSNKSEFYVTRELFSSYVNYNAPLSYEEWLNVADDLKAAVLYCQFFEQITLAWYKLKSIYSAESDGVAEAIQYLQKNVEIIKNDEKRFAPSYIYKIMYNCLYCLCRDPNKYKKVYENECSNIQMSSDGEYDLFDTYRDESSSIESCLANAQKDHIWKVIESRGRKAVIVVAELLEDDCDWTDTNADVPKANEVWRMTWKRHKCKVDPSTMKSLTKRACISNGCENAVRIHSTSKLDDGRFMVDYEEYVKDNYKGFKKFSKADHASVSDEEREEIIEFLRSAFGNYREALA